MFHSDSMLPLLFDCGGLRCLPFHAKVRRSLFPPIDPPTHPKPSGNRNRRCDQHDFDQRAETKYPRTQPSEPAHGVTTMG